MKIESFGDLEKLFELCQKSGVQDIRLEEVYIKFGPMPDPPAAEVVEPSQDMSEMSDDELIYYSVKDQEK